MIIIVIWQLIVVIISYLKTSIILYSIDTFLEVTTVFNKGFCDNKYRNVVHLKHVLAYVKFECTEREHSKVLYLICATLNSNFLAICEFWRPPQHIIIDPSPMLALSKFLTPNFLRYASILPSHLSLGLSFFLLLAWI